MKHLYLLRHAKSGYDDNARRDFDRPLTTCGERAVPAVGMQLKSQGVTLDLMIASPAKRTVDTAILISEQLEYDRKKIVYDPHIYEANVPHLLMVAHEIDDAHESVMMVGHNPGFTDFCNFLCGGFVLQDMSPATVIHVQADIDAWANLDQGRGELIFKQQPDLN